MVEKGDKGLDETPLSSFEDVPSTAGESPSPNTGIPFVENVDSDDDLSEDEPDALSQDTVDTQVVEGLNVVGYGVYDDTRCLVSLALRVKGHELYCGYAGGTCPRPKHNALRVAPGRRGPPGVYQQLPNSKGTVHDAVADTRTTPEALEESRLQNRSLLKSLGSSPEKTQAELLTKPRSTPVVQLNPTPTTGPRQSRIQAWSQGLPATPTGAPSAPQANPPTSVPAPMPALYTTAPATTPAPASVATPQNLPTAPTAPAPTTPAPAPVPAPPRVPAAAPAPVPAPMPVPVAPPKTAPAQAPPPPGTAPAPAPAASDPAVLSLLSKMVTNFDALTLAQAELRRDNNRILASLEQHNEQSKRQQSELETLKQRAAMATQPSPSTPPEVVSISSTQHEPTRAPRFYAVAKGRRPGVYTTWRAAERMVKGVSGAKHRRFRTEAEARSWLRSNGINPDSDDASDLSLDGSATVIEPAVRRPRGSGERTRTAAVEEQPVPEALLHGPDQSVGKPTEIHGTSIQVESEILKILCPKGVTAATRKDLMEAVPDVLSLPGKLGSATNDSSEVWDQFAGAVSDIAEQRASRAGVQPRDTQWKVASRNAIDKIKTVEDLYDAADEIGSQSDKVLQSYEASIQEILFTQGWAQADVDLYVSSGLLPRIVQRLLAMYYELYLHFQRMVVQNPDPEHFKTFTMLHIQHHARQLRQIRLYAVRRGTMILRSYTYMRDAKAKGFTDVKLISLITNKLQELTHQLSEARLHDGPATSKTKEWACSHCHSELHGGGPNACTLKDFKTKVARRIAKEAEKKVRDEPDVLTRLMAEEKARAG
jgi:hypothetical protein